MQAVTNHVKLDTSISFSGHPKKGIPLSYTLYSTSKKSEWDKGMPSVSSVIVSLLLTRCYRLLQVIQDIINGLCTDRQTYQFR